MFTQRAVSVLARRTPVSRAAFAARTFSSSVTRYIKSPDELFGPGAKKGEIASDLDQATGLDRYELLHQMEGIDAFDTTPLDSSRKGTVEDPIRVKSGGPEQFVGCSGSPAGSHDPIWVVLTKDRPISRCMECGSVYEMEYIGPEESHDDHHHGNIADNVAITIADPSFVAHKDPETFVDYVKPEYWHR
ncbi:cytochrome c oxidase polypeptide IV [Ascosphaera apis ARSEF 7405]|uniref:Cytochrome c oxidase polypeptide IV n=1 Tax=Ascosphaera apis ARSEF 7405 TaxID=392613 RepID=A0A166NA30_9EURO|nr:cytochrome c oxidase polypeptide IV [Ascosphaera apis ARSEF 7405]